MFVPPAVLPDHTAPSQLMKTARGGRSIERACRIPVTRFFELKHKNPAAETTGFLRWWVV
jgi:hypothetical protein